MEVEGSIPSLGSERKAGGALRRNVGEVEGSNPTSGSEIRIFLYDGE